MVASTWKLPPPKGFGDPASAILNPAEVGFAPRGVKKAGTDLRAFLADAIEFAGDDHQGFADAGSKATVGLHGKHHRTFADEFQWHRSRVEFQVAAAESERGNQIFESLDRGHVLGIDPCDVAHAGQGTGALDDFLRIHFPVHAENRAEFELADREGIRIGIV